MTSRVRWLTGVGILLVSAAGLLCFWLPRWTQPIAITTRHLPAARHMPSKPSNPPPFSDDQLKQFLAAARQAETTTDPLQRCLIYPDPPGLAWSKEVTSAYCHYQFDPLVTPDAARRLIETGHAAELDRRLAEVMHAQLSQPEVQGALDRTFNIDFKNGSEDTRALIDAWKRQSPASPFALAASGTAYVEMAQLARGSDYASKTQQSSFESMGRLLERARSDLDQAVMLDPHVTSAYGAMIYAAALDGDVGYAVSAAKRGLAIDPANYTIYARLVWMAQPKWGGTVQDMQRIINSAQRHAKQNPLLRLLLSESSGGEAYVEDCDCNPLTEFDLYRQVFAEAAPVGMLMSGGWAAQNRNSPALSVVYRSELLRFDPSKTDHRQGRAFDLPLLGQSEWALAEGNALIALSPNDENAFDVRGLAYESTGDLGRATGDYEQALRLNPTDTWTLAELGNIYVHANHDWDKGWTTANRLIQTSPDNPQGWLLRASIQKDEPRDGLNQTISDFVVRFGNDPSKQSLVAKMQAMLVH
jgi:tetratricopeptide (TPR) repeat protein